MTELTERAENDLSESVRFSDTEDEGEAAHDVQQRTATRAAEKRCFIVVIFLLFLLIRRSGRRKMTKDR